MKKYIPWLDQLIFFQLCLYAFLICIMNLKGVHESLFFRMLLWSSVIRCLLARPHFRVQSYHIKWIFLFLGSCFLSIFSGDNSQGWLNSLRVYRNYYFFDMLILFVPLFFLKKKQIYYPYIALVLSLFATSVVAIIEHFQGGDRVAGLTLHYMDLAGLLVVIFPGVFAMLFNSAINNLYKLLVFFITIVLMGAIIFNDTRTIWIICAFLLPFIFYQCGKNKRITRICMLFFCLMIAGMFFFNEHIQTRVHTIFDMGFQSNSERILLWKSSVSMFADYPLMGVGTGNFAKVYQTQYIMPEAVERTLGHAHNNILMLLVENGIFVALAYIGMTGYFLYESYQNWKKKASYPALLFFLATAGLVMQGMTEFNLYPKPDVMRAYWLLLGLYLCEQKMENVE